MQTLLISPIGWLRRSQSELAPQRTSDRSQRNVWPTFQQSMMSRHTCICCSNTLLRHARLGEVYWRCSHCYQEMPV